VNQTTVSVFVMPFKLLWNSTKGDSKKQSGQDPTQQCECRMLEGKFSSNLPHFSEFYHILLTARIL
jgi:hypothetical protein